MQPIKDMTYILQVGILSGQGPQRRHAPRGVSLSVYLASATYVLADKPRTSPPGRIDGFVSLLLRATICFVFE